MKRTTILIFSFFMFTVCFSQTGIPRAQAMFIYNFSRLIEWPANYKTGPFTIGVLGLSPTLSELTNFANGKNVGTQKIIVKKFDSPSAIDNCHILFVPFSKTKQLAQVQSTLGTKSTLVVTEKGGATNLGAAINFIIIGDKLKFEVKPANATSKNIKLSSKLSEMAVQVY